MHIFPSEQRGICIANQLSYSRQANMCLHNWRAFTQQENKGKNVLDKMGGGEYNVYKLNEQGDVK